MESAAPEVAVRALPRLRLSTKVLYGVGEILNGGKTMLFGLYLLFFYTTVMGLPGTLAGAAAAIGLVWDATIDPIIGRTSDRVRSRLGRRHTFMLAGAILFWIAFWGLFSPPRGLTGGLLFAWFLGASMLVRLANSLFDIPYHALGAELSRDYRDRTTLTGIRGACGLLGTMGLAGLSFMLFFPNTVPGEDPKLSYDGYPTMGLVLGLAMSLAALVSTLATLPWRPYLHERAGPERDGAPVGLIESFAIALRNRAFRALFLSFSLIFLAIVINATLSIHFMTYYAQITESRALSALQVTFYVSALLGVLLWIRIARVVEKRCLYLIGTLATALLMVAAILLLGEGRPFGTGDVWPLLVGQALAGIFGSIFWILPASMVADVTDDDELETGLRREGVFFGLFSFGRQLAAGCSVLVTGVTIEWFAGLVPGQAQQSAITTERIGILFGFLPAALLLVAAVLIRRYPLDAKRMAAIQTELASRSA